jgi:Xaa-Pro aminopeptidase
MTSPDRPAQAGRLHDLTAYLDACALDAIVVSAPMNVTYLTGFSGSAGLFVLTRADAFLIVDGRYVFAAADLLARGAMASVRLEPFAGRYDLTLAALAAREGLKTVGFEAAHVTVATLAAWQRATSGVTWRPTDGVVEARRVVKDAFEIATFRRAAEAISRVARMLGDLVARGLTEQDVASRIDHALLAEGFERPAFPTIVASGPNSALPHARPTPRTLEAGDLVVLDFGGVLDGYCVDLTRMAAIGPITDRAMSLYQGVRDANLAAASVVRPGIAASDVDQAARDVLEARGLGAAFLHATGHGLGLDVHEAPRLGRRDLEVPQRLEAGMVFTVEPGAYVEGVGGVRLEDDVLVTARGGEVLTDVPLDLVRV